MIENLHFYKNIPPITLTNIQNTIKKPIAKISVYKDKMKMNEF